MINRHIARVNNRRFRILDLTYSDAAERYKQPKPTWVAAPLVEWTLVEE